MERSHDKTFQTATDLSVRRARVLLIAPLAQAQQKQTGATAGNHIVLGRLASGAVVAFVRADSGDWGIEVSGDAVPGVSQLKPAQIEVYRGDENVRDVAAGYHSVQKETGMVVAKATVAGGGEATFAVEDQWKVSGNALSLIRKVRVTGTEDNAGFYSAIRLVIDPRISWTDADYFAPGLLYGEPHTKPNAPGGSMYYNTKYFPYARIICRRRCSAFRSGTDAGLPLWTWRRTAILPRRRPQRRRPHLSLTSGFSLEPLSLIHI